MLRPLTMIRPKFVELTRVMLGKIGLSVIKKSQLDGHLVNSKAAFDLKFLRNMPQQSMHKIIDLMLESKSQLRQDLFVITALNFKTRGTFVEFGATDGVTLSNSWMLEARFEWSGVLAEPARIWHNSLAENRVCAIDHCCVWRTSGDNIKFHETNWSEISTAAEFLDADHHGTLRKSARSYNVQTISLIDLLTKHHCPTVIDYLSIDTEGSELSILENFDFSRFRFRVITCEHNFTRNRDDIYRLLVSKGYIRVLENISEFDDWYVLPDEIENYDFLQFISDLS